MASKSAASANRVITVSHRSDVPLHLHGRAGLRLHCQTAPLRSVLRPLLFLLLNHRIESADGIPFQSAHGTAGGLI